MHDTLTNGSVLSFATDRGDVLACLPGDSTRLVTRIGWAVVLHDAEPEMPNQWQTTRIEPVVLFNNKAFTASQAKEFGIHIEAIGAPAEEPPGAGSNVV